MVFILLFLFRGSVRLHRDPLTSCISPLSETPRAPPLYDAVVASPQERKPRKREITDWKKIHDQNKKVLDAYFDRDKPSEKEFNAWYERIRVEHEDEFQKNVYIEYFEEPIELILNQVFYGVYVCRKCIKSYPSITLLIE